MSDSQTLFTPADAQTNKQHAVTSYLKSLEGKGVDVDRIELTKSDDVELEYSILDGTEHEQDQEWFYVVGSYLAVQEGGGLGSLEVTATACNGQTGSWSIEREWCERFNSGEWTEQQYLRRVVSNGEGVN